MVVKQVAAKKAIGSFAGLANYLLDKSNNGKKVYSFEFENCNFSKVELNLKEIEITTNLNQSAQSDKVLHLVVSFHEDEMPSKEQLKVIESELIKSIGMQEHQRLVVAHNNTNNFHLHIAINKIHPQTFKLIDPFQSKAKLSKKAFELEEKFGFKIDQNTTKDNSKIKKDTEVHTGVKNFSTWIKDELLEDIKELLKNKEATFDDLQRLLAKSNLEFKARGNGLVIAHKSKKLYVKSSSIYRDLSKPKLINRFKSIELKTINTKIVKEFGLPNHSLWQEYKEYSNKLKALKKEQLAKAKIENIQAKEAIKIKYQKLIKDTKSDLILTKKAKRNIYKSLFNNRKLEYQKLTKEYKKIRDSIHKNTNQISYKEYLIKQILEGNTKALKTLRKSNFKLESDENSILGKQDSKVFITKNPLVTKEGLIVYSIANEGKIIDKGNRLKITISNNEMAIKDLLEMSIAKYGNNLDITGDIAFKQKVLVVAKKNKLNINFKDKTMQEINKALDKDKRRVGCKDTKISKNNSISY